ncbi:MAG: hypothetical protein IH866_06320 [Chloroflexi bacterium]|nr:hypothetical protein [Chloroflexota bacterium]
MQQIKTLREADLAFQEQADYRVIIAELNPKSRKYALRALVNVVPPLDLGICISEVAHHLRSALDGLVYQLGQSNGATEEALTRTQFPIFLKQRVSGCKRPKRCRNKPPHFRCDAMRMIQPLCDEHQTMIERLQPYRRGNLGKRGPLYLLHELNNADKHRLLQVVGGKPTGYMVGGVWGNAPYPDYRISLRAVFEDGAKVGRVAASDVHGQKVQMEQSIVPYIAFWQGCREVRGFGVGPTLSGIAEHVSGIVEGFAPEFG